MALTRLNNRSVSAVTALPSGIIGADDLPSGSVLQVVKTSSNPVFTFSSTTWSSWGTLSITPSASNSKILALFNAAGWHQGQQSSFDETRVRMLRNGTEVKLNEQATVGITSGFEFPVNYSYVHLDTPNSGSQITYEVQFNTQRSDRPGRLLAGESGQELILMEIAG